MKRLYKSRRLIIMVMAVSELGIASDRIEGGAIDLLSASPLGKSANIRAKKGFYWIEYCPDNTCEVIRTKSENSNRKLALLAAGYFLYISKYSYLKRWQGDSTNRERLEIFLQSNSTASCGGLGKMELTGCLLGNLVPELGAELLFVRYDENEIVPVKIDLKKEILIRFGSGLRNEKQ